MTKRNQKNERRPRGFYPTPWAAFAPLVPNIMGYDVVEPCAGDGTLCRWIDGAGVRVVHACDIAPRHPWVQEGDATTIKMPETGNLTIFVTNPPWPEPRAKGEPTMSILRNLATQAPTWLLLPADFLHNVYAADPMHYCRRVISVGRVKWIPGTEHEGFDNAAWYLFDMRDPTDRRAGFDFTPNFGKASLA